MRSLTLLSLWSDLACSLIAALVAKSGGRFRPAASPWGHSAARVRKHLRHPALSATFLRVRQAKCGACRRALPPPNSSASEPTVPAWVTWALLLVVGLWTLVSRLTQRVAIEDGELRVGVQPGSLLRGAPTRGPGRRGGAGLLHLRRYGPGARRDRSVVGRTGPIAAATRRSRHPRRAISGP